MHTIASSKFELLQINVFDVHKVLFNIKATGADGIQVWNPKVTHSIVGYISTSIINLRIDTLHILDNWKRAEVTAMYKKGDRS